MDDLSRNNTCHAVAAGIGTKNSKQRCAEKLVDSYALTSELGQGAYATVMAATHHSSGVRTAVKMLDRETVGNSDVVIQRELSVRASIFSVRIYMRF